MRCGAGEDSNSHSTLLYIHSNQNSGERPHTYTRGPVPSSIYPVSTESILKLENRIAYRILTFFLGGNYLEAPHQTENTQSNTVALFLKYLNRCIPCYHVQFDSDNKLKSHTGRCILCYNRFLPYYDDWVTEYLESDLQVKYTDALSSMDHRKSRRNTLPLLSSIQ